MRIDWVPDDEQTLGCATLYRYGKHNGVYYIVGTGPGAIEEELKDWTQGDHFTIKLPGVKQRAELALSRWRNKTVDPQPIRDLVKAKTRIGVEHEFQSSSICTGPHSPCFSSCAPLFQPSFGLKWCLSKLHTVEKPSARFLLIA